MVTAIVVVLDELADALFELTWQIIVSRAGSGFSSSDDVARSLLPVSSDGKLEHGCVSSHSPSSLDTQDRTVIAEKPRPMQDIDLVQT